MTYMFKIKMITRSKHFFNSTVNYVFGDFERYATEVGDFISGSVEIPNLNSSGEYDFGSSNIFKVQGE